MRKTIIYLTAAALMLIACAKTPGEVPEKVADNVEAVDDGTPVPIRFGTNIRPVETKAAGPVESWNSDKLYIFGIQRVSATSSSLLLTRDDTFDGAGHIEVHKGIYIDNIEADAPAASGADKVLTGAIEVYRNADTQEYFFYNPSLCYNFYAYYIDDAVSPDGVQYTDEIVYRDITIDGTQDIMLATTNKENDIEAGYTGDAANKPTAASVYSAYSARKNIHPNLVFEHQLSRFRFFIQSGYDDNVDGAGEHTPGRDITIAGISLKTPTIGRLVIASNSADAEKKEGLHVDLSEESIQALPLMVGVANNLTLLDETAGIQPMEASQEMNGSILAMPGQQTYEVIVKLKQTGYTVEDYVNVPLTIDFAKLLAGDGYDNSAKKAKAGYQYNVNIVVWGLEQIDVNVSLTEWKDGGDFNLNPDDDPALI